MKNTTWDTDTPGLSLTDTLQKLTSKPLYKRSEDKRGHGTFLGGRFPKDMARWVTRVKEAGPYETNSDVVRDAVWLGLQVLELRYKADPGWQARIQLMDMANRAAWDAKLYDEEDGFVKTLDKLCSNGDEVQALKDLEERLALLSSDEDSAKRRRVLYKKLDEHRLGNLVKRA